MAIFSRGRKHTPNRSWLQLAVVNGMAPSFPAYFCFYREDSKEGNPKVTSVRTALMVLKKKNAVVSWDT